MEYFTLGCTYVAQELGQHCRCGNGRHLLEHVFFPVASLCATAAGHIGAQVGCDDGALLGIGHQGGDAVAEAVDGIVECTALATQGSEHHLSGGVEVLLVAKVVGSAFAAVGFASNGPAERIGKVVE